MMVCGIAPANEIFPAIPLSGLEVVEQSLTLENNQQLLYLTTW